MKRNLKEVHRSFCDYEVSKAKRNRMTVRGGSIGQITHNQFKSVYDLRMEFEKVLKTY